MFQKLPTFTKSFYFISTIILLFWMVFVDSNDLVDQVKLSLKLRNLEKQQQYYLEKIEEVKHDRAELLSNPDLLEKFAREKYFMKKKNEDIYIIEE